MRDDLLTAAEHEHAKKVRAHIGALIAAAGGWLSFERYMEAALYAPGLGYYSAGARKLGSGGDFITAPEVSGLFGACVAEQCAQVLNELGRGSILELGAGTGKLAADILTRLDALSCLPEHYFILDVSADLRERQRELIGRCAPHLVARVVWWDSLPSIAFDGVIVANEVLDALPVRRFRWNETRCEELGVSARDEEFGWNARAADASLQSMLDQWDGIAQGWQNGYVSEYCPRLGAWVQSIASVLRRGAILWFDYGLPRAQYYLPERRDGTLLCHFRHRVSEDPFRHPGLQDISAWVDFTSVAQACISTGWDLGGFTTQAFFLAAMGIDRHMRSFAGDDEHRFARLAGEAKQLMMPGEMGERFKAMAHVRAIECELTGFAMQDLRYTL